MKGHMRRASTPTLKGRDEIERMRKAGRVVHRVLTRVREMAHPGVTSAELNAEAETMIAEAGGQALFKGVENRQAKFPFPAALCTSVNDVVVHGIPSEVPLAEGDIISVDCGVRLDGYCGDSATTIPIGEPSEDVGRLLAVTEQALRLVIERGRPKLWWSEIAGEIQRLVEAAGFSVVREFVGHGIGRDMHEEPKVPNYVDPRERRQDFVLREGMTLAVEPMVNMGVPGVKFADATGWPIVTADGRYAAHYEHTIAITAGGVDVLTDGR